MSTSFWLDRTHPGNVKTYDVVVIGAGIAGLSTVYWLNKEDPSLKIALLERHRIGYGASGRNAGFITCGSVEHFNRMVHKHGREEATEIWKFAETNTSLLKEHIVQDQAQDLQFEQEGTFSLAATDSEFAEIKSAAELMKTFGIRVEVFDEQSISQRLGARDFVGGAKYLDDGAAHPVRLLNEIRRRSQFDLFEQTEVHGFESTSGGSRLVKTDNGVFETPVVIMALNGYLPTLHPFFADKVYPTRGQILVMEPIERFMEGPCYANFYLDYFRQLPGGELLIGGFRQLEKETEVGYSDHTTDVIQDALYSFIQKHLPRLEGKRITHRWGGVMGFSKDGQPLVGSLPEDNQIYFVGGFTGHGMGLGFHAGKTVVDSLFGREIPKWISARRFS